MRYTEKDLLKLPGQGETTGVDMVIKARSRDMGGDYSVMEGVIRPHTLLAPHSHKFEDQLVFVITGTLEFEVGGADGLHFSAPAGSYVQKPRGIVHGFWNTTDTPSRYIELSGRSGFEGFVDSTSRGNLYATMHADHDWGMVFSFEDTLRLMKEHKLKGLAMMHIPTLFEAAEVSDAPEPVRGLAALVKKLGLH